MLAKTILTLSIMLLIGASQSKDKNKGKDDLVGCEPFRYVLTSYEDKECKIKSHE